MAINIYKVVYYVIDTPTIRTPSKTSLEFSPLYSTAHAGSSVECVTQISKLTNWLHSLP